MKIAPIILGVLLLGTSTLTAQGYKSQGAAPRENQGPRLDQGRTYTPSQYTQQQRSSQQKRKSDKAAAFDGPVSIITPRGREVRAEIYKGVFQMTPSAIATLKQDFYEAPNGGTVTLNLPLDVQIIFPASNIHPVNICVICPWACPLCDIIPCPSRSDYLQRIEGTQARIVTSDGRQVTAIFDSKGQLQADNQTKQTLKNALQEGRNFSFYFQDGIVVNIGPDGLSTATGCCVSGFYEDFQVCCWSCLHWLFS